ncbi:MutS family domain IV, partial [Rhizoctonia solani]
MSRPTTAASTAGEYSTHVIAVLEGRGVAREIGMAALNKSTGQCVIFQIHDCQTYIKTLHHLRIYNPSSILVPDTFLPIEPTAKSKISPLVESIRDEFEDDVDLVPIPRKYWNDGDGLDVVNHLIIDNGEKPGTLLALYYALSATSALFKFVEMRMNTTFAPRSVRISFRSPEGTMMIDCETTKNLELLQNNVSKKSKTSLFGLLNHTFTPMAHRLLRINILAPITDQMAIERRLEVVQELVNDEEKYTAIRDALKPIRSKDFDKLIAQLSTSDTHPIGGPSGNARGASVRVEQIMTLRSVVRSLPAVVQALNGCHSYLLRMMGDMLDDERVKSIDDMVSQGLNDDALFAGGGGSFGTSFGSVTKKVYAVRANYNRLLDVARETYRENVTDIIELQEELSKEHDLPISMQWQDSGFVFVLKKGDVPPGTKSLPRPFINASMKKNGKWLFSHLELKKRNARLRDSLDEALLLSDQIVKALVERILEDIGFTGTLAIKAGRHPVLETVQAAGNFVPNDTYACDGSSFQIIEGPNMSGKSTYLRQIGSLVVMAMCGSFVPAEYASFRIHDSLLTRLSNDDDPERSLSTFAKEMTTSGTILSVATESSLILIDELGRGTSPIEGIGLAHAIAEEIIKLKAFTFFTTHFHQLTYTLSKYPTVFTSRCRKKYTREPVDLPVEVPTLVSRLPWKRCLFIPLVVRLVDGASDAIDHYGLELARLADLPPDVLIEARKVSMELKAQDDAQRAASESNAIAARRKIILRIGVQLKQVLEHSTLADEDLLKYLAGIQTETIVALRDLLPSAGHSSREDVEPLEPGHGSTCVLETRTSVKAEQLLAVMNMGSSLVAGDYSIHVHDIMVGGVRNEEICSAGGCYQVSVSFPEKASQRTGRDADDTRHDMICRNIALPFRRELIKCRSKVYLANSRLAFVDVEYPVGFTMSISLKAELEAWANALNAYDAEDFQKALELFEPISDTSRILTNIGLILATIGEHERAIERFKQATESDTYLAIAYFQCGVSCFLLGDYESAFEQFESALMWLRGNQAINYEQIGLNFRLYTSEILFNRGLCLLNSGRPEAAMQDLLAAQKEKSTPEHDVIDDAIREQGEGYTVFSIPVGVLFRPNPNKIKNLKTKDYLGKARLISRDGSKYEAFDGVDPSELAFGRERPPLTATSDPGRRPGVPSKEGANLGRSSSDLGGTSAPRNPVGLSRAATTAVSNPTNRPSFELRREPESLIRAATTVRPMRPASPPRSLRPASPPRPAPAPAPKLRSPEPAAAATLPATRGLSVRRPPGVLKPTPALPPPEEDDAYDGYVGRSAGSDNQWVEEPVSITSHSRAPSRSASAMGGRTQASYPTRSPSQHTVRRALSRKGTAMSRRTRSYDEEEGYVSGSGGDYEEAQFETTKIRVRLRFKNDLRGMAIMPDISCDDFMDRVCVKFGREYGDLSIKFVDDDGAKVTIMDESDFELAIETARAAALKGKESRLEIWCDELGA